jgi:hypothetical protein
MSVRAKFKVQSYETGLQGNPPEECRTIKMTAVYGDSEENRKYFKYTPNGSISLGILNQEAWKQFELGKEYYVEFSPAD